MNIRSLFSRKPSTSLEEVSLQVRLVILNFLDNEGLSWETMGLSHVETLEVKGEYLVNIHATRPALIIGRKGAIARKLSSCLSKSLDRQVKVKSVQHNPFK